MSKHQDIDITELAVLGEQFPLRLMRLGFRLMQVMNERGYDLVQYVMPPVCVVLEGPFLMGENKQDEVVESDEYAHIYEGEYEYEYEEEYEYVYTFEFEAEEENMDEYIGEDVYEGEEDEYADSYEVPEEIGYEEEDYGIFPSMKWCCLHFKLASIR